MEGDKVFLHSSATEKNGMPVFDSEIGQKPQFMLNEEYVQLVIGCAVESVRMACRTIYPDNEEMQSNIAKAIAIKVTEERQ